jgi:luciferase-like monooxygenase
MRGAGERIKEAVMSWSGVEAVPHRFGGTEYGYGRKEMGHVHGDRLADLPLPRKVHDEVIEDGRAQLHHVLPDTGW